MAVDPLHALLTLAEFQQFRGVDISDETDVNPDQVEKLIDAVSLWFENMTGRKLIASSEEYVFSGRGNRQRKLPQRPITGTPVISYRDTGATWTVADTTMLSREYDTENGIVYLLEGNVFWSGVRNWKVAYNYGFEIDDVPADVKFQAIAPMVQRALQRAGGQEGLKSTQLPGGGSTSYNFNEMMTNAIAAVVRSHKVYA